MDFETKQAQLFWGRVHKGSEHWYWNGCRDAYGIGYWEVGGVWQDVRLVVLDRLGKQTPPGAKVFRTCKKRGCIHPKHMAVHV